MKKKIIIVSLLVLLIIVLLLIPKDVYTKIFNKEEPNTDEQESLVYQTIYAEDSNGYLVGIKVGLDAIEEDEVSQKWDILTSHSNLLPNGYSSPIDSNCELYDYTISAGVLTFNVSSDFVNSDGRTAVECIAWNFCNEDVNEVVIKIDEEVINEVNNYYFNKISKNLGVNLTYETAYLFETDFSTVILYEDGIIRPVTYFFDDEIDNVTFTLNKIFKSDEVLSELVSTDGYSYEITDNLLVISINATTELNDFITSSLTETVKQNYKVNGFIINGIDSVILEQSFIENTIN